MLLALAPVYTCAAQNPGPSDAQPSVLGQYSATAIGQAGTVAGRSFGLTIYVQGVTSDEDLKRLEGVLRQKGQDGLISALDKMPDAGRVSPTGSVGTGVRLVRVSQKPGGGQHIVMATDRPITFAELYNGTRSTQYKLGIVVLDVDKAGNGTGLFAPLCKVKFNKQDQLEIENYGQKPFRLANVYRQK
jgi:hypothetical protein